MAKFLKFEFDGIDEYTESLKTLEENATGIIKCGIYDGAGIALEAVREAIREVTSYEATGSLAESVNLQKHKEEDGYIYTKIIFPGYDENEVPQAIKARVLENGRSDQDRRVPTHFCSKAVRKAKTKIEGAMDTEINKRIYELMRKNKGKAQ